MLLAIARSAIGAQFGRRASGVADHAALTTPAATFVTLKQAGELRGCIGSLERRRPLGVDVRENAIAAAFRDPRFPPLDEREFATTRSKCRSCPRDERIDARDEEDLLALLRPGVDGVIVQHGAQRATFLPQVWESFADPRAFLAALKRKAGCRRISGVRSLNVSRYAVTKWAEPEFQLSEEER